MWCQHFQVMIAHLCSSGSGRERRLTRREKTLDVHGQHGHEDERGEAEAYSNILREQYAHGPLRDMEEQGRAGDLEG